MLASYRRWLVKNQVLSWPHVTVMEYLKDPNLVVRFQNFFGVYSLSDKRYKKSFLGSKLKSTEKLNVDYNGRINTNCGNSYNKTKSSMFYESLSKERGTSKAASGSDSLPEDLALSSESECETSPYVVNIKFWYYFFMFGTYLGDEVFYAIYIPFWFWNIDGAVGRRIVMVWSIIMYIGQGLKDVICWPRPPCPPVVRLQKKWSLENGMPSTHAMVGVAIPFSVVIYTMDRYQYSVEWGLAVAVFWCAIISLSRIYLGMHSVLDVVAGLALAMAIMVPAVPLVDALDDFLLAGSWSPLILAAVTIPMIVFFPSCSGRTPTKCDTTTIVGFCVGVYIGAWTNYQQGMMSEPPFPPPYVIIWPSWSMCGMGALRTVIGLCSVVATVAVGKAATHAFTLCSLGNEYDWQTTNSLAARTMQLASKYLTYCLLGFNVLYLMPNVFKMLVIERPTYYTEM